MRPVILDFETYFDRRDYSLSKMTTESYVRDQRFEAHGAAVKWSPSTPAVWYDEKELRWQLAQEDWSDVFLICHHSQFDGLILNHRYGVRPAMWGCTLSMARLLLGNHVSASLDSVRKHFGMPGKITPYSFFEGRHWHEITRDVQEQIGEGACDEVESIWKIFCEFAKTFPAEEYDVVDSVIRMFVEPKLIGDTAMLAQVWQKEALRKSTALAELSVTEAELQSADRFADLLRAEGVEPETKDGKNGPIYAFAKNDDFMRDFLLEHESPRVRTLAETRLGVKSTLLQTRAETLGWMASRGPMPVYLRYSGAATLRFSGGDGANWQNFKRGSDIRRAICAPEGYLLAPIDLSQVEVRVCAWLAREKALLDQFRNKQDPYTTIATEFYGREITKKDALERGTGKQAILSCQYGSSGKRFQATAKLGIYGPPVLLELEVANHYVDIYRNRYRAIVQDWRDGDTALQRMASWQSFDWGILRVECDLEKGTRRLYFPNGTFIVYDTLDWYEPSQEDIETKNARKGWRIKTRFGWKNIYGSMLTQHRCEAVSRLIMTQAMLRIKKAGLRPVNSTHDELLVLVPKNGQEEKTLELCIQEMTREPSWLPGIFLEADGSLGERYEK